MATASPDLRARAQSVRERLTSIAVAEGASVDRAINAYALGYLMASAKSAATTGETNPVGALDALRDDLAFVECLRDGAA